MMSAKLGSVALEGISYLIQGHSTRQEAIFIVTIGLLMVFFGVVVVASCDSVHVMLWYIHATVRYSFTLSLGYLPIVATFPSLCTLTQPTRPIAAHTLNHHQIKYEPDQERSSKRLR